MLTLLRYERKCCERKIKERVSFISVVVYNKILEKRRNTEAENEQQ